MKLFSPFLTCSKTLWKIDSFILFFFVFFGSLVQSFFFLFFFWSFFFPVIDFWLFLKEERKKERKQFKFFASSEVVLQSVNCTQIEGKELDEEEEVEEEGKWREGEKDWGGYLWRKDTEVNILPADNVVVSILQIARIKFAWHKFDKYQNQKSVKA